MALPYTPPALYYHPTSCRRMYTAVTIAIQMPPALLFKWDKSAKFIVNHLQDGLPSRGLTNEWIKWNGINYQEREKKGRIWNPAAVDYINFNWFQMINWLDLISILTDMVNNFVTVWINSMKWNSNKQMEGFQFEFHQFELISVEFLIDILNHLIN